MRYFENMTSFSPNFQPRIGTRKVNGGAKFSDIKVQKKRCNVSNRLKFGKITWKDLLCKKNGYRELIIVAL